MTQETFFAVLKIEVGLPEVNRKKISICYNECYKK